MISVAVSRITGCHECYGITQSLLPSGDLRSLRASVACAWFFGTKGGGGSFPFAKCIYVGHELKDGCPTKSGVVIFSLANKQSGIGPRLTTKLITCTANRTT